MKVCSLAEPSVWLANGYPSVVRQVRLASSSGVSTFAYGSLGYSGVKAPRCSFWVILGHFGSFSPKWPRASSKNFPKNYCNSKSARAVANYVEDHLFLSYEHGPGLRVRLVGLIPQLFFGMKTRFWGKIIIFGIYWYTVYRSQAKLGGG